MTIVVGGAWACKRLVRANQKTILQSVSQRMVPVRLAGD